MARIPIGPHRTFRYETAAGLAVLVVSLGCKIFRSLKLSFAIRVAFAVVATVTPLSADAGTTQSFTYSTGNYAGSRDRRYKVYVPTNVATRAPLVMALHGCQQTNDDVLNDWGLTAAADRYGFLLVAPFITSYDGLRNTNCWGFWLDQHRHQGRGEVEDLHQIALQVEARFAVDPAKRYITGLSSGAAMTVAAAIAHNEYWAAAASAAGLPYGEDAASVSLSQQCPGMATFHSISRVVADMRAELNDPYPIPLLVLQSNRDCVVVQPAGNNLRDAHLQVFGDSAHDTANKARIGQRACRPSFRSDYACQQTVYTGDGGTRSLVETVFYDGPAATPNPSDMNVGHYWIGGEKGNDGRYSMRQGPSYPDIIWDFFARHPRGDTVPPGHPIITLNGADPLRLTVGQTFIDPGATATDREDGNVPVQANCSAVDTSRADTYTCTYTATDRDGNTTTATRTVLVSSPNPESCAKATAPPLAHINANRAIRGGPLNLRAIATGNGADIGFGWDSWSRVTLYEGAPGRWYPQPPVGCPS